MTDTRADTATSTGPAYRSFLVRLWHTNGQTRASIQDIATGTTRTFPSVAALCAWLDTPE